MVEFFENSVSGWFIATENRRSRSFLFEQVSDLGSDEFSISSQETHWQPIGRYSRSTGSLLYCVEIGSVTRQHLIAHDDKHAFASLLHGMLSEEPADRALVGIDVGELCDRAVRGSEDNGRQSGLGNHLLDLEVGSHEHESFRLSGLHDVSGQFLHILSLVAWGHEIEGDVDSRQDALEPNDHAIREEAFRSHVALVNDEVHPGEGGFSEIRSRLGHVGPTALFPLEAAVSGQELEGTIGDGCAHAKHPSRLGGCQVRIPGVEIAALDIEFDLSCELDDSRDVLVLTFHASILAIYSSSSRTFLCY